MRHPRETSSQSVRLSFVIANGGGYDEFVGQLVSALEGERIFLELVEGDHSHLGEEEHSEDDADHSEDEESHDHDHGNEHIWYDIHAVEEASEMIVEAITELRPESFDQCKPKLRLSLWQSLRTWRFDLKHFARKALGLGFIATEGVGNLLLEEAGFVNQTPDALADAIEEEREVPATALKQAQDLIAGKVVSLVVVNEQQLDQVSDLLVDAAKSAGVPVVELSELISEPGIDYLDWMASILDQLQEAVY
jgi:zinc/manganese transport system substrate-binding protein